MDRVDLYQMLSKKIGTENSTIIPQIWRTICCEVYTLIERSLFGLKGAVINGFQPLHGLFKPVCK